MISKIAYKYGVSQKELMRLNNKKDSRLKIGEVLILGGKAKVGSKSHGIRKRPIQSEVEQEADETEETELVKEDFDNGKYRIYKELSQFDAWLLGWLSRWLISNAPNTS